MQLVLVIVCTKKMAANGSEFRLVAIPESP